MSIEREQRGSIVRNGFPISTYTMKKVKDPISAVILLVINPNNAIVCKAEV